MSPVLTGVPAWTALTTAAAASLGGRDLIVAVGPDTTAFLQGQLSQDLTNLVAGDVCWALHLQPQGKVIAVVRLTRLAGDAVLIDTDLGAGTDVHAALTRFKIRTKCELTLLESAPSVFVRGPTVPVGERAGEPLATADEVLQGAAVTLPAPPWAGPGHDVLASTDTGPHPEVDAAAFEAHRVFTGVPLHGHEISGGPIPVETGLIAFTVAFGKGCYVGQELVERLDSRGRQIRRLVALDIDRDPDRDPDTIASPQEGAVVSDGQGAEVGRVTSAAQIPGTDLSVALAVVRATVADADLRVGGASARIRILGWQ